MNGVVHKKVVSFPPCQPKINLGTVYIYHRMVYIIDVYHGTLETTQDIFSLRYPDSLNQMLAPKL